MIDTYVACAMSALPPEEYEHFRHTVLDVCSVLKDAGKVPYDEPFAIEGGHYESPAQAMEKNFRVLDEVQRFILLYTHKETTSALIELGYALHRHVPIVVFARRDIKLPYYLREPHVNAAHDVRIVPFDSYEELPKLVENIFA